MIQLKTLHLIQKVEQRKLQQLTQQLTDLQQLIAKEQQHAKQLREYSNEYQRTLTEKLKSGLEKELIQNYYSFIQYLKKVVENQEANIQRLLLNKGSLTKIWQNQFIKNKSLEKMILEKESIKRNVIEKKIEKRQEDIIAMRHQSTFKGQD